MELFLNVYCRPIRATTTAAAAGTIIKTTTIINKNQNQKKKIIIKREGDHLTAAAVAWLPAVTDVGLSTHHRNLQKYCKT